METVKKVYFCASDSKRRGRSNTRFLKRRNGTDTKDALPKDILANMLAYVMMFCVI